MEGVRTNISQESVLLYLDTLEAAGRSPLTIIDYRRRLVPFLRRLNGLNPTNLDIRDYLDTIKSTNNKSVTLVVLRQWFKFLRERGLFDGDPAMGIPLPKQHRRNYPPVSPEEFTRLVTCLPREDLRVLAYLFYRVGCRHAEAVGMKAAHVSFEGDYGTIEFPHRKGETDGFAAFGPDVAPVLRPFLAGKEGSLFGFPSRASLDYFFRVAGERAGIPGRVTPHRLRHMFITVSVDAGWNQLALQQQIGHRDPTSTAWYYRPSRKGLREAYRRAENNA